jgi:hypothetical protein
VKPGDLVTIRRWNLTHRVPITYVDVHESIGVDGWYEGAQWKWEHGEVGILLDGRDDDQEMVQVLLKGRAVWVDEEFLRVIDETG